VTTSLWIGALKFTDHEAENAEPLVTGSPLTSRLCNKLGAQKLARLVGVMQMTLGSLIAWVSYCWVSRAAIPFCGRSVAYGARGAVMASAVLQCGGRQLRHIPKDLGHVDRSRLWDSSMQQLYVIPMRPT
jgi:hypothetical protein